MLQLLIYIIQQIRSIKAIPIYVFDMFLGVPLFRQNINTKKLLKNPDA